MSSIKFNIVVYLVRIFITDKFIQTMTLIASQHGIIIQINFSTGLTLSHSKVYLTNDFLMFLIFLLLIGNVGLVFLALKSNIILNVS